MKIDDHSETSLFRLLKNNELCISLPPFVVRFQSNVPSIARDIRLVYGDFECLDGDVFSDFHVELRYLSQLNRWVNPKIQFFFDGQPSFSRLSADQAFPTLEWGLNWCVAAHSHQYLIIHAAVIERNGDAVILPAPPGSGKSTLCAALAHRGWRLLSDELALFDFNSGLIFGMARPVSLKNQSISVLRAFEPSALFTEPVKTDSKGFVALMKPPTESVVRVKESARPKWVILPKYLPDSEAVLEPESPAKTFLLIAEQSFNYDLHGQRGFDAVGKLLDQCHCARFTYSRLDDAVSLFSNLEAAFDECRIA